MPPELLVATRKGLFQIQRTGMNGNPWTITQVSFLGDNVGAVAEDPANGTLIAGLNLGHFGSKVRTSTDRGRTWTDVATPEYPPKPEDEIDNDPFRNTPRLWKLEMIWCLEAGHGQLWCGTLPGGLFRSDDQGRSWTFIRSLWDQPDRKRWFGGGYDFPGIHSILLHPTDRQKISVGVSCGGVWHSQDNGSQWRLTGQGMVADFMPPEMQHDAAVQDPHRVVSPPTQPERLWVQHHGGIFRSDNGGQSWVGITAPQPSGFGFAVAVHPKKPDTAWFVPAKKDECRVPVDGQMIVTRTDDAGQTFRSLRNGLPQSGAYDLIYRHALDVDATGDCLAMGSTTGSLWISENGGDDWLTVSQHLPPIYATRFSKRS